MKHDDNLVWYDFFRGIAALLVISGHLRALMFIDSSQSMDIIGKVFYFMTGFGHQAVVIFFVLSGFFIIRSIHESVKNGRWNSKDYILNRMTRLWIVLIPALFMTLLWDKIGLNWFKDAYTYTDSIVKLPGINPTNKLGIFDFLGNVFFLQMIKVQPYGTNVALWSLTYEFWYYVMFPLIYFSIFSFYKKYVRIILILLFGACIYFVGRDVALYFIIWLMGGLAYIFIKNNIFLQRFLKSKILISLSAFIIVLFCIRIKLNPSIFNDFSLGIVTTLMLCVFSRIPMKNLYLRATAKFVSNISYTVYLTHLSFAVLLVTIILNRPVPFSLINLLFYLLLFAVIMLYCYALYYLFERNTVKVKKWIKRT